MITKLTKAQEARMPEFAKKWIDIGLCTKPADREKSEKAIKNLYALAKLKEPTVIWLPCPLSAAMAACTYAHYMKKGYNKDSAVGSAVDSAVRSAVRSAVGSAVGSAVDSAVRSAVDSAVDSAGYSYFGGSLWAGYGLWGYIYGAASADYFNEVLGVSIDRNYLDIVEGCGYFWTLDSVCFASERPKEINLDDAGQLHSERGMSISYPSGWGLFHWHGVKVPGEWILDKKSLTAKIALGQKNVEVRRAACEILGWGKVLDELGAKSVNKDSDPEIGELLEVNLPDSGKEKFLKVQCGTGRIFAIPVPPEMKTALEANSWTWNLKPEDYLPEIRT